MQTRRLNRIPRIHARQQLGLCSRLHRWLLLRRLGRLSQRARELKRGIALDEIRAAVHRLHFDSSPVLRSRLAEERRELAHVGHSIVAVQSLIAELEMRG